MYFFKFSLLFFTCLIASPQILRAQDDLLERSHEKRQQSTRGGAPVKPEGVTNPAGEIRIMGSNPVAVDKKNVSAIAIGEGNTAKNTSGAIKGGAQIQGNTNINAKQKNASAVAVGKNNTASNDAGEIGSKGDTVIAIGMGRQDQTAGVSGQISRGE